MKVGITYHEKLNGQLLSKSGFDGVSVDLAGTGRPGADMTALAFRIPWKTLGETALPDNCEILVVDTCSLTEREEAKQLEEKLREHSREYALRGLTVCIENGVAYRSGRYVRGFYDDTAALTAASDRLNSGDSGRLFAAAFNIAYSNLLGQNPADELEALGDRLKVLYISDNDAMGDYRQLPYTFTRGRGILSTDWVGIIRAIVLLSFDGLLVADIPGTVENTPAELLPAMLELMRAVFRHMEDQLNISEAFSEPGKTLVIFGTGNMFRNYMRLWGKTAKPAFAVDNNSKLWGERKEGIEIRPPEAILEIPPEKRNVWICNIHFPEIKEQLKEMGIESRRLEEWYFVRNPWENT
ncbi:MAG: hypothetical protein K5985_10555 [Lachnospiraceae bacterium]|nr:hypothetical protein [Lachnospiraceae bacterium]